MEWMHKTSAPLLKKGILYPLSLILIGITGAWVAISWLYQLPQEFPIEKFALFALLVCMIGLSLTLPIVRRSLHREECVKLYACLLAKGNLPVINRQLLRKNKLAENLAKISTNLSNYAEALEEIGEKNFNGEFKPLDENDVLGVAILSTREKIKAADLLERESAWIIEGTAEISEILRSVNTLENLGLEVVKFMIDKIGAVQGAFYALSEDEDEQEFEMKACFGYGRKKFREAKFKTGEGLVGQAIFEKDTVYRTELPNDYFFITSGLISEKKPNAVLITPLINNDKVYGALEFGAIRRFTSSERKFAREVGPSIARTIFNVLVNEKTTRLLKQSQEMSAELRERQEALRKTAEETRLAREELEMVNARLLEQMEEVKNTQKRMGLLLENASEIITVYEEDTTIRYISPSVKDILGYTPEQLIGLKGKTQVNEEDLSVSRKMFNNLLENPEKVVSIQYRFQRASGDMIWLEATGKNLLSDAAVKGIVINARDITNKRKAELEEREKAKMQSLSENSPDLIARISSDETITYVNPAIEKFSGAKTTSLIGRTLKELETDYPIILIWEKILEEIKATPTNLDREIDISTPTGFISAQVSAIPEFSENILESVLIVSRDITERKIIEMEIQEKNKKINESINYSKRIQNAILPDTQTLNLYFPESFIFFQPRDVVSGDFPWMLAKDDFFYLAAVDCTGHGVPGAMLSLIGRFLLHDVVENGGDLNAGQILDLFDQKVNSTLNIENQEDAIKDGMDIALCKIELTTRKIDFAGAHRPLFVYSKGKLMEFKGDRWAIGGGVYKNQTDFTNHHVQLTRGDQTFIFSDGLPDQFGGPENRKFGPKRIKEIIEMEGGGSMKHIKEKFEKGFYEWKGESRQMDDVLLIGFEF